MENNAVQTSFPNVVIVGAGPVGLTLALELSQRGVSCMLIEERTERAIQPRAKQTNTRSMEHFRRLGVAADLRRAAPLGGEEYYTIYFVTSLTGHVIKRFDHVWGRLPAQEGSPPEIYAEPVLHIPQTIVEDVLLDHVRRRPEVQVWRGWRLEAFHQHGQGVTVEMVDAVGRRETVETGYLAGCDGSQSTVRKQLGISWEVEGASTPTRMIAAIYRAPTLRSLMKTGPALQYWVVNSGAYLGPLNAEDRWWLLAPSPVEEGMATHADARDLFLRSVGADIPCEVIDVQPWNGVGRLATRYREDRVFLLGDAAHLHPPTGGYGMNMGIGDAVDVGWKLAAVLQGWGGAHLFDSYEQERRPVHRFIIKAALANFSTLPGKFRQAGIDEDTEAGFQLRQELAEIVTREKSQEFCTLGAQFGGCRYDASPLIVPDGTQPPPVEISTYTPSAFPGLRAPHRWLANDKSLYDEFGPGFTLLHLGPPHHDTSGIEQAAQACGVPLKLIRNTDPQFCQLYQASLVLVRPDQHVAWRSHQLPSDPQALLDQVRGAL